MKNAARLAALERHFGRPPDESKSLRVVEWRAGEPEPVAGPGEELLVVEIVDTGADKRRAVADPTNGRGRLSDDDLAAEIERLERRRDILKARKK